MNTRTLVPITMFGLLVAGSIAGCGSSDDDSGTGGSGGASAGSSAKAGSSGKASGGSGGSGATAGKGASGGSNTGGKSAKGGNGGGENTSGANAGGEAGENQGGQSQGGASGQSEAGAAGSAGAAVVSDCTPPDLSAAPTIVSDAGTGTFPTDEAGGKIESGTYYETTFTDYHSSGGDSRHGVMIIDTKTGTFNVAESSIGGTPSITLSTFTTSGTSLILTVDCGSTHPPRTLGYTYADGVITIYNPTSNVTTYTKQ